MKLRASYLILPDYSLIIEKYTGVLRVDTLIQYKKKLKTDPAFSVKYNIFVDVRDCNFRTEEKNIIKYAKFVKDNLIDEKNLKKIYLLTSAPDQVATVFLYSENIKQSNYKTLIGSTYEMGQKFLNIPPELMQELDSILNKLQDSMTEYLLNKSMN